MVVQQGKSGETSCLETSPVDLQTVLTDILTSCGATIIVRVTEKQKSGLRRGVFVISTERIDGSLVVPLSDCFEARSRCPVFG